MTAPTPPPGETFSAADSAWLRMDNPTNLMNVTAVVMLERPLDLERLGRLLEERFLPHERFRMRPRESRWRVGRPTWEPHQAFDLDEHLRRARLPAPADERALQAFVSDLMSIPLSPDRPLWQLHYVENFGRGAALVARLHHCIADGVALVRLLLGLAETADGAPLQQPKTLIPKAVGTLRGPAGIARATLSSLAALGKLAFMRFDPRTPLKGPLGTAKVVTWSQPIPLEDVKRLGKRLGSTVNDVLLTAVAGALRRYLARHGAVPRSLTVRAVVPVNLRGANEAATLGNRFGLVFLPLPVGLETPLERLASLKRRMDAIKRSTEAFVVYGLLRVVGATASVIEGAAVGLLGQKATAVMTNVPGPQEPLYLCGSRIDDLVFWVPQSGRLGLGVSIFSYTGRVRVGIATDRGIIGDPDAIVREYHAALDELVTAAAAS